MTWRHWLGARLRRGRAGLWYHPDYSAPGLALSARAEHVQLERGERIVGRLLQERLIRKFDVRTPPLASLGQLKGFHSLAWLESAERPETLGRIFGLEPHYVDTELMLRAVRRAVGGTVCALTEAASGRLDVALNLGGGFHHAEPEIGSGFCVFNDVGVAIAERRKAGWTGRVAIIDLDFHQGNGNTVAFANDPSVFVYSIHGAIWSHGQSGGREIHLPGAVNDRRYLAKLRTTLETELHRFRPDVVVYIAGADVLAGDELGSFWLTLRGVFERDRHVFEVAESLDAPVVVTFGGGYGKLATQAHYQLVRAAWSDTWRFDQRKPPSLRSSYARIAASLDRSELQGEDEFRITEEDIYGALGGSERGSRFLSFYSVHGMELVFERYGILDRIRARGFSEVDLEVDVKNPAHQVLRVRGRRPPMPARDVLLELVCRRRHTLIGGHEGEFLFIEWLLLQDPSRSFSLSRPPLPGQEHPGLGVSREVQELLRQACTRLGLDGLLAHPAHYHSAAVARAEWRFVDPEVEGRFRALRAVLAPVELYEATRFVHDGRMQEADGTVVRWEPGLHVLPVGNALQDYLDSAEREEAVRQAKAGFLERGLQLVDA